jgi:hypothetical protein
VIGSEDVGDANMGRVAYEIALWVLKALLIFSALVLAAAVLVVVCLAIVRRLAVGPQDDI